MTRDDLTDATGFELTDARTENHEQGYESGLTPDLDRWTKYGNDRLYFNKSSSVDYFDLGTEEVVFNDIAYRTRAEIERDGNTVTITASIGSKKTNTYVVDFGFDDGGRDAGKQFHDHDGDDGGEPGDDGSAEDEFKDDIEALLNEDSRARDERAADDHEVDEILTDGGEDVANADETDEDGDTAADESEDDDGSNDGSEDGADDGVETFADDREFQARLWGAFRDGGSEAIAELGPAIERHFDARAVRIEPILDTALEPIARTFDVVVDVERREGELRLDVTAEFGEDRQVEWLCGAAGYSVADVEPSPRSDGWARVTIRATPDDEARIAALCAEGLSATEAIDVVGCWCHGRSQNEQAAFRSVNDRQSVGNAVRRARDKLDSTKSPFAGWYFNDPPGVRTSAIAWSNVRST